MALATAERRGRSHGSLWDITADGSGQKTAHLDHTKHSLWVDGPDTAGSLLVQPKEA